MKKVITYTWIAKDGREFKTRRECQTHEKRLKNGAIVFFGSEITKNRLHQILNEGFRLCNYSPGYIAIHANDYNGGGKYGEIFGPLADKLGKIHNRHNYQVHVRRGEIEG